MPNPVLTRAIDALASGRDLRAEQAAEVLAEIMAGNASEVETAGRADRAAHEGGDRRRARRPGAARCARFAKPVHADRDDLIDTAGTGGGRPTFNVSTTAALIAAGAGCAVAKHGNRSATGLSGSADVLEALGVAHRPRARGGRALHRRGRLRLHVRPRPPRRHALRHPGAQGARRPHDLQLPRPADQPGRARRGRSSASPTARSSRRSPARWRGWAPSRALVVSSDDGLDEMSTSGDNARRRGRRGELSRATSVAPEDVGPGASRLDDVAGGTPDDNADDARRILAGEPGPARDLAVLNAGAAIYVAGRADSTRGGRRAPPRRRSTTAPPRAALERLVALTIELAPSVASMSVLDADRRATRASEVAAPARERPARRSSRRRSPRGPRAGRSPRRCCAPASR